jgi:hypothetical protein
MDLFLHDKYIIFLGLYKSLELTKGKSQIAYEKVLEAQKQYFINISGKQFSKDQEKALDILDNSMHKFYLGGFSLEQLWGITDYLKFTDHGMPPTYNSKLTYQQNEIVFLLSLLLDQALYNWRSFLDYFLKYLLYITTGEYLLTMSTAHFRKKIEKQISQNENDQKTINIYNYIKSNVLCQTFGGENEKWGDLLRSLRDKSTHQKLIKPTIVEKENEQGFIISWPTIKGLNYSDLAQQEFENNAFEMIRELFPILFGFNWKSGPYYPGLFAK